MQDIVLRGPHEEEGDRDGQEASVPQQLRSGEAQQGERAARIQLLTILRKG